MDDFTKTYLSIIEEWKKTEKKFEVHSLPNVAIAVKRASNDFKKEWKVDFSGRTVLDELKKIEEGENTEFDDGTKLVLDAYEFWDDKNDDFGNQCKNQLKELYCPSEKIGLLSYAIWQGIRNKLFKESNITTDLKIGDKVNLRLKFEDSFGSVFNFGRMKGWKYNHFDDQITEHYICSCDKYPNIKFDVIFSKETRDNFEDMISKYDNFPKDRETYLKEGDVFDILAKVKNIDEKRNIVFLNYGKIDNFVEFSKS